MTTAFDTYAKNYAAMSDEDLQRLSLDVKSLLPAARDVLRMQMELRQLPIQGIDWTAELEQPKAEKPSGVLGRFFRNFAIFFVCDALFMVGAGILFSSVESVDAEKIGEDLTTTLLSLSVITAFLTARYFVPKRLRTVLFIGVTLPAAVLFLIVLFH